MRRALVAAAVVALAGCSLYIEALRASKTQEFQQQERRDRKDNLLREAEALTKEKRK